MTLVLAILLPLFFAACIIAIAGMVAGLIAAGFERQQQDEWDMPEDFPPRVKGSEVQTQEQPKEQTNNE